MNQLKKNNINLYKERGKKWINDLPRIVEALSQKWQLNDVVPVDNMSWNYVAKASSKLHGPVCIKISIDEDLILNEIKSLKHFDGFGMINLINSNSEFHAILLDQAIPGKSLKELYCADKDSAMREYANVVTGLSSSPKAIQENYKHISYWLEVFDVPLQNLSIERSELLHRLVVRAKSLSSELITINREEFLLHGDLHMDNIISNDRNYVAIDPKGIVGPKEFEVACFDFITKDELLKGGNLSCSFYERSLNLSRLLKIDHEILVKWVFIRLVVGVCWTIEDNCDPDELLKMLEAIFPDYFDC